MDQKEVCPHEGPRADQGRSTTAMVSRGGVWVESYGREWYHSRTRLPNDPKYDTEVLRVRLKIIGNSETVDDSDLPTFLIISSPIIFKRTVNANSITHHGTRYTEKEKVKMPS